MNGPGRKKNAAELGEEIIRLGPWHIDVQVTPEVSTAAFLEASEGTYASREKAPEKVSFLNPGANWMKLMNRIYPGGLQGRTFLECACNCGAYCFWARELGAGRCFGFDVREHWIDQARFLKENRTTGPTDGIDFGLMDLYDLPQAGLGRFDVTMFQGIFYHLPDPITGLKAAADLTDELLLVDTATRNGLPDGMLAVAEERKEPVMSGVYGLNWFPTGPGVLKEILAWLGFPETWTVYWRGGRRGQQQRWADGRVRIIASRKEGLLDRFESATEPL